jgi:hypothetical protein
MRLSVPSAAPRSIGERTNSSWDDSNAARLSTCTAGGGDVSRRVVRLGDVQTFPETIVVQIKQLFQVCPDTVNEHIMSRLFVLVCSVLVHSVVVHSVLVLAVVVLPVVVLPVVVLMSAIVVDCDAVCMLARLPVPVFAV